MKTGFVYIMTNKNRTTLYVGVTNNIERRVKEHKAGVGGVFTSRYMLYELLYFERIEGFGKAIDREKQLKSWRREWKWELIKADNPDLVDQAYDWFTVQEIDECRLNYKESDEGSTDSESSSE